MSTMNAAIIIPVYNHEQRIAGVIRQTLALGLPVFVVDDGSTDRTAEIIKAIEGITVLHHCVNQGKGAAILTGFAAAVKKKCDLAITIDGDGQHTPEDAETLLSAIADGKRCLVVGRRQGMEGGNVPWTSRFGRKFSNFWVRVSGGPAIEDSQS
ncbi:MAG TPA: glycosyltransferase family 2 protein, partial [Desulfobacteraceae bacterium]|nr:glycosyltransferase family 2 protein [Desulfobacteraceae bacterium]